MLAAEDFCVPKGTVEDLKDYNLTTIEWTPEPKGTKLTELKGASQLRAIIKQVVKDTRHEFPGLSEKALHKAVEERRKRNKIAKARKIEPGTAAWKKLTGVATKRGKKRG